MDLLDLIGESKLVADAKAGDVHAFGLLLQHFEQKAFLTAMKLVHDEETAQELCQDAFLKAFRSLDSFDETKPFYPWLHQIVKNVCIGWINWQSKHRHESLNQMIDESAQFASCSPDPRDIAADKEMLDRVWNAIDALPPLWREVLLMHYVREMKYEEIAKAVGIPVGTVMSRLFNARKELKKMMA